MNDAEIKQQIQSSFDGVAGGYDKEPLRFFSISAQHLLDKVDVQPSSYLDIATGTGAVSVPAAKSFGAECECYGVDLSDEMMRTATNKAAQAGVNNIEFKQMDMQQLDFKDKAFDLITCAYGLFFLPDMSSGLAEMQRVLKRGGKLILSSFTGRAFLPCSDIFLKEISEYGIEMPGKLSWERLGSKADFEQLFKDTDFNKFEIHNHDIGYHLDCEGWWTLVRNSGFNALIKQLEPEQYQDFKTRHLESMLKKQSKDGIWIDASSIYAVATRG